jgi:hypothetical protein
MKKNTFLSYLLILIIAFSFGLFGTLAASKALIQFQIKHASQKNSAQSKPVELIKSKFPSPVFTIEC